jgi:hypothetical protein
LKQISRGRQSRADQVHKLNFAESAARLLVRQQFLQPDDLPRQLGDAFLSGLDDRQASLEIGEVAVGQLAVFL